ncbi:hypothetical protein A3H11_03865 [Candidatus Uhrbacteria bacterium RIFCSPLOWO2_12_FULL_47_10]|nr:MAG: hypothetical protein A3H11_03865 [Candidatus Uhrbacteria bacterium RIFCSPLOWO2_12_FULL_47_10]
MNFPSGSNDEFGGYWRQGFTTTGDNPTTTVSFDWQVTAFDSTPAPITFKLFAFVDTGTGVPVIGQEVWTSGEITGTSAWAAVSSFDVSAKVTTAGTYYLKVAVWLETPGSSTGPFTLGFDNVALNWTKTTNIFDTSRPTIYPNTALTPSHVASWNSFTETATKNGGEIYYQLSDDNGVTWKFWNGSSWATAGAGNYNTATAVNTNIASFPTAPNQIKWNAFLESDGTQQVILDTVTIGYTDNDPPDILNLAGAQQTSNGRVYVTYDLQDDNSDPSSLVTYEYSLTGAFAGEQTAMTADTCDVNHSGVSGLTSSLTGTAHTFVWNAGADLGAVYNTTVYARLRANDGITNGAYASSSAFTVDYVVPTVSNVSAAQTSGTTNVAISYDVSDNTADNLLLEVDISEDGGATWTVTDTSVSGNVGSDVTSGVGKSITWSAGTDFANQQQSDIQVRVRAKDKYQNQGVNVASVNFSLDTLPPVTLTASDLLSQPVSGDTAVLIGGSFTETNPNTNDFYVAINGESYGSATSGTGNTATPSNQSTAVGAILDGNDYISKVKITHTDDFGQATNNENTSSATAYKYVKPYTPQAPTLSNPVTTRLDLLVNPNASEASSLEYAIQETTTGNYAQGNGTLGVSAVWRALGTSAGQWGDGLAVSGKVRVTGLTSPVANYIFKVKSRNISDGAHASSSESAFSATAQITNTAPSITFNTVAQPTDGTQYVNVNYTGTDGQGDIASLDVAQYSTDNSTWSAMAEKSGAGSEGTANLTFLSTGSAHIFAWDSGADLPNVEDDTVYVRLRGNDTLLSGTTATASALAVDNKAPVVANATAAQDVGARTVTITYDLTEHNTSTVVFEISQDGGSTWTVTTTSASGALGAGVTAGTGKIIAWNAGTDFDNQYQIDMRVRLRATDTKGNASAYAQSANFTVDTNDPVVSNVTAAQDSGANTFTFNYDVSEDAGNVTVGLEISGDGGSTWTVPITSAAGAVGAGVTPGTGKTITWNGATDYNNQEKTNMKIRITATDGFSNNVSASSANFSLDTKAPRVTNMSAAQVAASTNVTFTYDLADQNTSLVELDISEDSGATWTVTDTSVSGNVGSSISAGASKTITWAAGTDFDEQQQVDLRVRVRANDPYNNQSANASSVDFFLDTLNPAVLTSTDLLSQPVSGDTTVLIGGSFTETNPNTNDFYVAINGGAYGSTTSGTGNTATPSNQATAVGATLDGNDYISKVKIVHTDDFGQAAVNENTSPTTSLKYVKPYTPSAPTVDNPAVGTVDVLINPHASETTGLEYAIFETSQTKYVQSNGTLGASAVWQTLGVGAGQWGQTSGVSGKIIVNGLATHSYLYQFRVKSRNTSDGAHVSSSESALSSGTSSTNQSPTISLNSVVQTTDGTKYVTVNYTISDLESESVSLVVVQYSTDGTIWETMTEKTGAGSQGTAGLSTSSAGQTHTFVWDVATDLVNKENNTVYARLQANDGTSNGGLATSSAFTVDTKIPVISQVNASQVSGSNNVTFTYKLTDLSQSNVELDISEDGGATWTVTDTNVSGDVGSGVASGTGKTITWSAGVDFDEQEQSDLRVRVRATDAYGNAGINASSANFTLDTKNPVVGSVTASQNSGSTSVTIAYTLADTNTSTVELDISEDNGATWSVTDTSVSGNVGSGITAGSKTITWSAGTDFSGQEQSDLKVRVRATDTFANASGNVESNAFSLDTKAPTISNLSASQTLNSQNAVFTYTLSDSGPVTMVLDISSNGGNSWGVTDTSVTGDIGAEITAGSKTITWNAGTDFSGNDETDMRIRLRGTDSSNNVSAFVESANFSVDTKAPVVQTSADLKAQPSAGDTTVLIGGSFTESNPNTSEFFVALNGGYGGATAGGSNTAAPADQATAVGATLDGNDVISKVKIVHTDDFGKSATNENTSPNADLKYVKPYTPQAPTVNNPQNTSVDITINPHASEAAGLKYAIYEETTNKYASDTNPLTLKNSPDWKTLGVGAGEWGQISGVSGKITLTGLSSPVAQYRFKVKSRNISDTLNRASSESALSAVAAIANTAPTVAIVSAAQATSASYVTINYTGTDAQNDTNNLVFEQYLRDGTVWNTMTEKSGVGSESLTGLAFSASGTNHVFAWDAATDIASTEDSTVYIRLQSTDTLINSNTATSSAFTVDTLGPAITNINVSQTPATGDVVIDYDLDDISGADNTVELSVSDNNGQAYKTPSIGSVSGDVGSGISAGKSKRINNKAKDDFPNNETSNAKAKIRATDKYGNVSTQESGHFTFDTKKPVVQNVSASQGAGSTDVAISYELTDGTPAGHLIAFEVSEDGGTTWTVTATTTTGEVGTGQTTGTKSFTWKAGADFSGKTKTAMRLRARSLDYFGNQGSFAQSADFALDTEAPSIGNMAVAQTLEKREVEINYDLNEFSNQSILVLEISSDGGASWTVATTTASGDIGASVPSGAQKKIIWNAEADFPDQEKSNVRTRLKGTDTFGNQSMFYESADFSVDTAAPLGLASFSKFSATETSATVNWATVTDAHFSRFELWHGTSEADVQNRSGSAQKWGSDNDSALAIATTSATVITGISTTGNYYVKIWAIDAHGNEKTVDHINVFTSFAAPPGLERRGSTAPPPSPPPGIVQDTTAPGKPILSSVATPTKDKTIKISGLAEADSSINIYDKEVLIEHLTTKTDKNSEFEHTLVFEEGEHVLTVRAIDESGNVSDGSDPVNVTVDLTAPASPILLSHHDGDRVTEETITLLGVTESFAKVEITFDGETPFEVSADENGGWTFILPNTFALEIGTHEITARAFDLAGNRSKDVKIRIERIEPVAQIPLSSEAEITPPTEEVPSAAPEAAVPEALPRGAPSLPGVVEAPTVGVGPGAVEAPLAPSIPVPSVEIIRETTEAIELPGVPAPKIVTIVVPEKVEEEKPKGKVISSIREKVREAIKEPVQGKIFTFSGTALPKADVVIYIHSAQAVIYRTKASKDGIWTIRHSQDILALSPGVHTIFAVSLDPKAKVKSRPSPVAQFTVTKNKWVALFQYLNLPTTAATVIFLMFTVAWLYKVRSKREAVL